MEITGWTKADVVYHLNRYEFDLNEALDQYYLSQQKTTFMKENGEIDDGKAESASDLIPNSTTNVEYIANL